jgi:hypothetical protein
MIPAKSRDTLAEFQTTITIQFDLKLGEVRLQLCCHCKFTGTAACHINHGNQSSLSVSFFGTSSQQGFKTHLGFPK